MSKKKTTKKRKPMNIEMVEPKEVVKAEKKEIEQSGLSPEALILQGINKGLPIETMKELLAMRTQLKNEWAKEHFESAMGKLQGQLPIIKKRKAGGKTNAGDIAYYYAPLDSIVTQIKDIIRDNGFSYDFVSETLEGKVKVMCHVNHVAGYTKTHSVEVPLGTKTPVMSAPQVVASALTFAKRYAFCDGFGITTADDDNYRKDLSADFMQAESEKIDMITEINIEYERVRSKLDGKQIKYIDAVLSNPNVQKEILEKVLNKLKEIK